MQTKREELTNYTSNYCATYLKAFNHGPFMKTKNDKRPPHPTKCTLNVPAHPTRVQRVTGRVTGMHARAKTLN